MQHTSRSISTLPFGSPSGTLLRKVKIKNYLFFAVNNLVLLGVFKILVRVIWAAIAIACALLLLRMLKSAMKTESPLSGEHKNFVVSCKFN